MKPTKRTAKTEKEAGRAVTKRGGASVSVPTKTDAGVSKVGVTAQKTKATAASNAETPAPKAATTVPKVNATVSGANAVSPAITGKIPLDKLVPEIRDASDASDGASVDEDASGKNSSTEKSAGEKTASKSPVREDNVGDSADVDSTDDDSTAAAAAGSNSADNDSAAGVSVASENSAGNNVAGNRRQSTRSSNRRTSSGKNQTETKKRKEPLKKSQIVLRAILAVILVLLLCVIAAAVNRWLLHDDSVDIQGQWYVYGTDAVVEITDTSLVLAEDVSYAYELDTKAKTISYTFGSMSGGGHYRFSEDRNMLAVIEDGQHVWTYTAVEDFKWWLDSVAALLQGESILPADLGQDTSVFVRVEPLEEVAEEDSAENSEGAPAEGSEETPAEGSETESQDSASSPSAE